MHSYICVHFIVKSNLTIAVYTHIYKHTKYTSQNYSGEYIPVVKQQVWWTVAAILFFSGGKAVNYPPETFPGLYESHITLHTL